VSLRQLLGEQRKCMDERPRLPSTRMTHLGSEVCIAAVEMILILHGRAGSNPVPTATIAGPNSYAQFGHHSR
jgi:hypothetical protein